MKKSRWTKNRPYIYAYQQVNNAMTCEKRKEGNELQEVFAEMFIRTRRIVILIGLVRLKNYFSIRSKGTLLPIMDL